jgi:hypothetical protein
METFMAEYARQLEKAVREHPEEYGYGPDDVPGVVNRIRHGLRSHGVNIDGRAFKATCQALGIKHTQKAISEFIANHE